MPTCGRRSTERPLVYRYLPCPVVGSLKADHTRRAAHLMGAVDSWDLFWCISGEYDLYVESVSCFPPEVHIVHFLLVWRLPQVATFSLVGTLKTYTESPGLKNLLLAPCSSKTTSCTMHLVDARVCSTMAVSDFKLIRRCRQVSQCQFLTVFDVRQQSCTDSCILSRLWSLNTKQLVLRRQRLALNSSSRFTMEQPGDELSCKRFRTRSMGAFLEQWELILSTTTSETKVIGIHHFCSDYYCHIWSIRFHSSKHQEV